MQPRRVRILWAIANFTVLGLLSGLLLIAMMRTSDRSTGLNGYNRARFMDMVEGKAYKPFVYRTLVPSTVRAVTLLVPDAGLRAVTDWVERTGLVRRAFVIFRWETWAAFQYLLNALLTLLCFMGFGYWAARLTMHVNGLPESEPVALGLAVAALIGLPPFFVQIACPYDPPLLLLFTLALYFMVRRREKAFFLTFVLCCLNKETAILLIPLFGLTDRDRKAPTRRYWATLLGLLAVFVVTRLALVYTFRDNPGSFVEFHLSRNVGKLSTGWTFTKLAVVMGYAGLLFFRWGEKPGFLKIAFAVVLPPLVALTFFLGYANEWRDYYEAYPIAFGLVVHTILRLRDHQASPDERHRPSREAT
jgi:hypothetical protein